MPSQEQLKPWVPAMWLTVVLASVILPIGYAASLGGSKEGTGDEPDGASEETTDQGAGQRALQAATESPEAVATAVLQEMARQDSTQSRETHSQTFFALILDTATGRYSICSAQQESGVSVYKCSSGPFATYHPLSESQIVLQVTQGSSAAEQQALFSAFTQMMEAQLEGTAPQGSQEVVQQPTPSSFPVPQTPTPLPQASTSQESTVQNQESISAPLFEILIPDQSSVSEEVDRVLPALSTRPVFRFEVWRNGKLIDAVVTNRHQKLPASVHPGDVLKIFRTQ